MADFKLSIPVAVIAGVISTVGGGIIGMHSHESVLTTRVDAMEKAVASQQIQLQNQTSEKEMSLFREDIKQEIIDLRNDLKQQGVEFRAQLRDIQNKVSR